ncbi:L-alanine-DL-glutamate epimerase [Pyrenophora tritici-repentis]|nr:L-alanine-DL-glutamate epimerase [Pyrenophora tritici-repentis]
MAAAFVEALNGLKVAPKPLQQFTSQNTFAEFYSSSFPVFALGSGVSNSDLQQATRVINQQAEADLGYEESELAEMGYAAAVPEPWQLHERSAPDAARWYHEEFNKDGPRSANDPQWLTTTAAIGAAALYYTTTESASPASPASPDPPNTTHSVHRHESAYASDVPKPVEDRHGDSVEKHSIAAHKNQNKVREGKFSGKEFDNHVQTHSPGKPGGDFEKR